MNDDENRRPMKAAELARLAAERAEKLRAEGAELKPVVNSTRKLAANFWGGAWMRHLAQCEAGGLSLAPGRSLLRHGCVLDLHISPGKISGIVSAEELYEVELQLAPLSEEQNDTLRSMCSRSIGSLVALLEGQANAELLEKLCEPETGLLPAPADWRMSCTCPDWTEPCPHAAAAIYAAGVLIDRDPTLLFTLRTLDPATLIALPSAPTAELNPDTLADTFGIAIDLP